MIVSCSWHVLHRKWPLTSMRPDILSDLQFINPQKQKLPGPYFNLMTSVRVCVHSFSEQFFWNSFLFCPLSPKGSTSSDASAQILAEWKRNNNLTTCYCACMLVVTTASSQSSPGEEWLALAACLLSALCVYSEWNSKWRICLPAWCALLRSAHCTDRLCKWRESSPKAWKSERHCALHRECLWERWGVICRERRSVKRWLMKGKARQESSFLPLNLSLESSSNTSLLEETKTKSWGGTITERGSHGRVNKNWTIREPRWEMRKKQCWEENLSPGRSCVWESSVDKAPLKKREWERGRPPVG